jgi:hypothetical protein
MQIRIQFLKILFRILFFTGADIFRLNFSHGEHQQKADLVDIIRAVEKKYDHPIAILADLQVISHHHYHYHHHYHHHHHHHHHYHHHHHLYHHHPIAIVADLQVTSQYTI